VVAVLRERRIPFAVVGAAAMAVHGVARSTFDLDLLAPDPRTLARPTWAALQRPGVTIDIRVGDADDPLAGVVRLAERDIAMVDVIVSRGAWQTAIVDRARPHTLEDIVVPVVTAADLIALKLYAGGSQDAWDIEQLLQAGNRAALAAAVEALLPSLPEEAHRLWARVGGAR
jgi:hypothetical protein